MLNFAENIERGKEMKRKKFILLLLSLLLLAVFQSSNIPASQQDFTTQIIEDISLMRNEKHNLFTVISYHLIKTIHKNPNLLPSKVIQSDDPEIKKLAAKITIGKRTDSEKSMAIFDWVTTNIKYDADLYQRVQYSNDFKFKTAVETLHTKIAMCMGISHLNAALHRAAGIEAKVVYGGDHAWNEVKLDGYWQEQDATRGAGYINNRTLKFVPQRALKYFSFTDLPKEGEYLW